MEAHAQRMEEGLRGPGWQQLREAAVIQAFMLRPATVAEVHFFSRRTDGVSLQIQENSRVLSEQGWTVIECSADAEGKNSFCILELDYTTPQVQAFKGNGELGPQEARSIEEAFEIQVQTIRDRLRELIRHYHPLVIHVRNILSLPIHPAATVALAACIGEHPTVRFLAQHHDFSFEDDFLPGDRKKTCKTLYPLIQQHVEQALLFQAPNVYHTVINSLMQQRLLRDYGIRAAVLPDAFDFKVRPVGRPGLREKLGLGPNDIAIGMMTRILPRKAIEVALQFAAALQRRKREFLGAGRGVHGRTITEETRFPVLLPQAAGLDEPPNARYFNKLRIYAQELGVTLHYLGEQVVADSAYRGEPDKFPFYSLYPAVDILTFPSYREGFGNQLLEAVALGKGVVVCHAYPVMEADIFPLLAPDGIISLGNNSDYVLDATGFVHLKEDVLQAAVEREIHFLLHPDEEQRAAQRTRRGLAMAFDASVVGSRLAELLVQFS
jgi:hypothetical protein